MIKLENFEVVGWEHAIRGMRNPMNSWDRSDSTFFDDDQGDIRTIAQKTDRSYLTFVDLGPNDCELMMKLANAGDDHGKVLRFLEVYADITAPLYFWKEFRTYRKGRRFMDDGDDFLDPDDLELHIETNSCSTMHKIHEKEFTLEDFSWEHLNGMHKMESYDSDLLMDVSPYRDGSVRFSPAGWLNYTVKMLNICRDKFLETKDKTYWWQMIQLLPSSYNQKRTVKLNYQVLRNMYRARKNHKLDEWREFCKWIESLPYSEVITG